MLFNSIDFLIFFPIVTILYFAIPNKYRYIWLLIASYYFYMNWNAKYALLLLLSTGITYLTSLMIAKGNKRKFWLIVCAVSNLGILGIFKYFDFALDNINKVLSLVHVQAIEPVFDIVLPVGISFYTFQALSYTIDVYRGEIEPEKNFAKYALFVSFFPQLVAGPIERSGHLLKQIQNGTKFDYQNAKNGLLLMMWGLFEKIVIADRAAVIVNEIYENYENYWGSLIVVATILFAIQIYCDFAGYSHIAVGAANVMGYDLMNNFEQPYFATSIKDFWRRWHISLSTWFRDYLYIPLGGNRCSKWKKYRNLLITFSVSGLWHGASWHFVIWGGLHGIYQVAGNMTTAIREKIKGILRIKTDCFSYCLFQRILTFSLVVIAWFFFRMNNLGDGIGMLKKIFTDFNFPVLLYGKLYQLGLDEKQFFWLILSILMLFVVDALHEKGISIRKRLEKQNLVFRWMCYLSVVFFLLISVIQDYGSSAANFIYFQF